MRLTGRYGWLSTLLWLALIATAQAASVELRVAIEEGVNRVKVGSYTDAVVLDEAGRNLGEIKGMSAFYANSTPGGVSLDKWKGRYLRVEPKDNGYVFIGDRWYRGKAYLIPRGNGLVAVNHVDLEQYLYSVLGAEMNGNWPQEALKAQAVAARSYALYQRQRAANRDYDVGDTQAWQVYEGLQAESTGTQTAVNATSGQVLVYGNDIIEAVFHSSAGSCTDNVENIWTQALPYLRSVRDFDEGSPQRQWTKLVSREELSNRTGVARVLRLEPVQQTSCGRIQKIRVVGESGSRILSGDSLRQALGLKSTLFVVNPVLGATGKSADKNLSPLSFRIDGQGFGHGLGLSQWGAYYMALKGSNYQQIVLYYYQNTQLAKIEVK